MTDLIGRKTKLSIVICTYNNADSLALTLRQLSTQILKPNDKVEVILVNNNSSDKTAEIAEEMCAEFTRQSTQQSSQNGSMPFYYVFEAKQGLSQARNTGVDKAQGEYILFTDDDAELPNNWISAYLDKIELQPDCLFSSIHVLWDKPQPWWYQDAYRPCFVELNYGQTLLEITDIHHEFFGKNFCVKKELIIAQGGFDCALGRIGSKLIAGEETLLYRSLIQSKKKVFYFPDAPVGHRLKPKEYTEEHITKLFVDGAYSSMHLAKVNSRRKIANRPLGILIESTKSLLISSVQLVKFLLTANKKQAFYHRLRIKKSLCIVSLWIKNA
jgi:glucosyl-dolichyl phosphate glucuronosyltransferase